MNKRNWLRIALAMILVLGMIAAVQAESNATRQVGERFEGTIILEGMDEPVQYEHIGNKALGFEMDYDMVDYILSLTGMSDLQKLPEDTIRSVLEQHKSGGILRIPKEYGMFIAG